MEGFSYFLCFQKVLHYFSAAYSHDKTGVSQLIVWNAIKYGLEKKTKLFEIGHQVFKNTDEINIDKLKSISLFKRGFGGYDNIYLEYKSI